MVEHLVSGIYHTRMQHTGSGLAQDSRVCIYKCENKNYPLDLEQYN